MNLKFVDDIFQTIEIMKTGFYYLGLLAGVHTVTFAVYLAYKYLNDNSKKEHTTHIENTENTEKEEPELPPPLPQVEKNEPIIQMEEIKQVLQEKQLYKEILEQKRDELSSLIFQLDTVYDNIGQIRERLESLNNKQ